MRVALAAESFLPRVNGVANSVIHISRYLASRGVPIVIVAPDAYDSDEFEGIPVERVRSINLPGVHDYDVTIASTARLERIIEDFGATVVHLASPFVLGSRMQTAAHLVGVPTVAVYQTDVAGFAAHYGFAPLSRFADTVVSRIHGQADLNLVPSSACRSYLDSLGIRGSRLWGRGVDLDSFSTAYRSPSLRRSWAAGDRLVVGFVGRLAPEKNIEILARLAHHDDVQLVVIGDGPCRIDLARILPRAHFTGRLVGPALGAAIASLDVLVAPGEHETFCQVVQEAMASGVAVVAPAVGGPVDLIEHGTDGLLYRPGDATSMAAAVLTLGRDVTLRQRLVSAGQRKVRTRSWQALGDELFGHYLAASGQGSVLEAA